MLASFSTRIARLREQDADLSPIDTEQYSGIAGTTLSAVFHYDEARWLAERFAGDLSIEWEECDPARFAAALPRFLPLLEEDSWVEADVPYRQWIEAASRGKPLAWLLAQLAKLPLSLEEQAEIYGQMELRLRWELGDSPASRTHARRQVREIFYHKQPFIRRSQVSLVEELTWPPLRLRKLSLREGTEIVNLCREATEVRYRELYGTTRGDPAQVLVAEPGRGVQIYLWGLPRERRLPLRAYQAGFTLKNGVPINYIEGISLFEWMEIGFNTYYAYREGETAWIYAQVLRALRQVLNVSCISVYPYQIGKDNEEAVNSGAFWFYRKLGFRPMRPELAKLVMAEERKIAADPRHRTSKPTLRRLAEGHVVFELPGAVHGEWDGFSVRRLGLAVQEEMARRFRGDAAAMRRAVSGRLAQILGIETRDWDGPSRLAFERYGLALSVVPDVARWSEAEKKQLLAIIHARGQKSESEYSKLLLGHARLRAAIRKIGLT